MNKINLMFLNLLVALTVCGCAKPEAAGSGSTSNIISPSVPVSVMTESATTDNLVMEDVCSLPTESLELEPLEEQVQYEYFSEEVDYEVDYIDNSVVMPHLLLEPSTASTFDSLPLVVWLHGSGEKNSQVDAFRLNSLRKPIAVSGFLGLEGFNAYFIAPHLVQGEFWSPFWCTETSANNIQALIDYYVENFNIDARQVVITGHSLGGQGAAYLPQVLPDTFCAMAPLSVYHPNVPLTNTDIPAWCFEGSMQHGEDKNSYEYAMWSFARAYGSENITVLPTSHGGLPREVLTMDTDGNMRNDLLEWMAVHMENSASQSLQEQ